MRQNFVRTLPEPQRILQLQLPVVRNKIIIQFVISGAVLRPLPVSLSAAVLLIEPRRRPPSVDARSRAVPVVRRARRTVRLGPFK